MYVDGKKQVGEALGSIAGVNVAASYNVAMEQLPSILYAEVANTQANKGAERRTNLAYSIDIYSKTSTTSLASKVDDVMTALGFKRGTCLDLGDPSGLRHKNMKYTAVYDALTGMYYQE